MKLYATTTSERASKGQGGNKYLNIEIQNEEAERIYRLNITNDVLHPFIALYNKKNTLIFSERMEQTKGKNQKGDN